MRAYYFVFKFMINSLFYSLFEYHWYTFIELSDWQLDDTLALLNGNVVSVQEVAVETCLEAARKDLSEAVFAVNLVSVDPVQDVEESVHSEGSNIVWGYVFNNSYLVKHDNLWDECECLQPEGQAPL